MTDPVNETPVAAPFDPTAPVEIAGLIVPAEMVPRLIVAFRGVYRQVTETIQNDEEAIQAVLKFWTTQVLETWEGLRAEEELAEQLEQLRQDAYAKRDKARDKARKDAEKILKKELPKPEKPEKEPKPEPEAPAEDSTVEVQTSVEEPPVFTGPTVPVVEGTPAGEGKAKKGK